MTGDYFTEQNLPDYALWQRLEGKRVPLACVLEMTARCNNACRHCYINLPADDRAAQRQELSLDEICGIADQALELGTLWFLLSGGEPLLRPDFLDIYLALKRRGLLLGVFTNACLLTEEHVRVLKRYPPRNLEVTVYGVTEATYERVTQRPGSYAAFRRGLDLLLRHGVRVNLKAVVMRANLEEYSAIAAFCRAHSAERYRFDPQLHLRYDGDAARNAEIQAERLTPEEIITLEGDDDERFRAVQHTCAGLQPLAEVYQQQQRLFRCDAGNTEFYVGYDGRFRACSALCHPDYTIDLRRVPLADAWQQIAGLHQQTSATPEFVNNCLACELVDLCMWCPAHAHLETGRLDGWCDYFCQVAHARAAAAQATDDLVSVGQP